MIGMESCLSIKYFAWHMNIKRLSIDILFVYFEDNLDCFITDQIDLNASNKSNVAISLSLVNTINAMIIARNIGIVYDMYMYRLYIP